MENYSGYWTGTFTGTNRGSLVLEVTQEGERVRGNAKFNEPAHGRFDYAVTGVAGPEASFDLIPTANPSNLSLGKIKAVAGLRRNGQALEGRWKSEIQGREGTFTLQRESQEAAPPVQRVAANESGASSSQKDIPRASSKAASDQPLSEHAAPENDVVPSSSSAPSPKSPDPVSISGSSVSDLPTARDSLGFEPYVQAVAQFLLHEDTTAPLTMSIEGEWGSGKSSFMKQLQAALEKRAAESAQDDPKKRIRVRTVWFNPWRHDKNDELWAAFALEFIKQLASKRSWAKNLLAARKLTLHRISDWGGIFWETFRFSVIALVWMIVAVAAIHAAWSGEAGFPELLTGFKDDFSTSPLSWLMWRGSGAVGVLIFTVLFAKKLNEFVGNPLEHDFKKYVDTPNYTERMTFIERFHEDFKSIVTTYADGAEVFVFIDDLDRCEVPKAAELMQAINLMISNEAPIFFIIGMDREKVAAGVAAKHEKLLPFLTPSISTADAGKVNAAEGLVYGLSFVEKFIQLAFRVPVPGPENVRQFFTKLQRENSVVGEPMQTETTSPAAPASGSSPESKSEEERKEFELRLADDSPLIERLCAMVAPALENNPRRLKQFINAFRLKAYICFNTGLLDGENDDVMEKRVTLPMLAKFIAIGLRWPLFLNHLVEQRELFSIIKPDRGQPEDPITKYWGASRASWNCWTFSPTKNA